MTGFRTDVTVVGAGLAGSSAAWHLATHGLAVRLVEMRPVVATPVHHTDRCAELVCSNSFRSDDAEGNAVGVLHAEMRLCGSLVMRAADANQVPAGGALAVDRTGFADAVTEAIAAHPAIRFERDEVGAIPGSGHGPAILATGPLTSPALAEAIRALTGADALAFFDAIAPIVHRDTIDMDVAWMQSRYDKTGPGGSGADYVNCPMTREQYGAFIDALLAADTTEFKAFEAGTPFFDGCLPIEVMAARGRETLRHGPMKPFGLTNPHGDAAPKPYAVVQLRQDNRLGTLFNMVGFQTKLRHGEQVRVFRTIPGLERAEFARLGGLHRNTFLDSPRVLDGTLRSRGAPHVRFAGQITGCEGYVESAATGFLAAHFALCEGLGLAVVPPPPTTAHGALLGHITGGHIEAADEGQRSFQPMNVNFGLFPEIEAAGASANRKARGLDRRRAIARRALADFRLWWDEETERLAAVRAAASLPQARRA